MLATWRRTFAALRRDARGFNNLVNIVEVGPRDGLQNVKTILPTACKVELVDRLSETGLRSIEVTSFVSAKWVPQMADGEEVLRTIKKKPCVEYPVLVPNVKGAERALAACAEELVVSAAASESFNRKNLNCSIADSLASIRDIGELCKPKALRMRGVISCIAGCPFEGDVAPAEVARIAEALFDAGCYEVCLGDTIGVATPKRMGLVLDELRKLTGGDVWRLAVHCHDTYGQAIANVFECLEQGVRVFDSSIAGLGGCPFAPGATGNVATEDLVYMLHGQGMETGVDLEKLIRVGEFISAQIPTTNHSKVAGAFLAKEKSAGQCS